jgi:hypothetical protein
MLTAEQQAKAKALVGSIDWTKIDWTKIVALIQMLIAIFGPSVVPTPGPTPAPMHAAALRQLAKDAGCPDHAVDLCCACMQAGTLALQAAETSFACCQTSCTT